MKPIERFFLEIDQRWKLSAPTRPRLRLIGSAALILQADYHRGTKDSDLLETTSLTREAAAELRRLAGPGTALAKRHRMYVDVVRSGVPFLPHSPACIALPDLNERLRHFELDAVEVVDIVVSKLKRMNANDRADIAAMIDLDLVPHARLVERFMEAVDSFSHDARAEDLPRYIRHLNEVERDLLATEESDIELPGWIG